MFNSYAMALPIECERFNPKLINAIVAVESRGDHEAVSSDNALGLMQIKYETAKSMGFKGKKTDLNKPQVNLKYGCMYLYQMYIEQHRNIYAALDAYYRGPTTVKEDPYKGKWKKHPYIKKIKDELKEK